MKKTIKHEIVFVTGNAGKADEVSRYLEMPVKHQSLELAEIQSLDLEEIVKDKVSRAYKQIGKPVLVEDVALTFHSLGKLPGPFIKWFYEELGNDGLCRLLDGKDRSCTATVCYGYYDGNKTIKLFEGSMAGTVSSSPLGSNSFGWASIFIPEGHEKTYAELTNDEHGPFSMRKKALKKLRDYLNLAE